jgi:hypothetical protein
MTNPRGEPRFVVRELDGYPIPNPPAATSGTARPQLSVSVLDSAYGYREIGRWNTEWIRGGNGLGRTYAGRRLTVRRQAAELAAKLNALDELEP